MSQINSIFTIHNRPPRNVATDQEDAVFNVATAITAVGADIWAGYAADPSGNKTAPGKCLVEVEAVGFPCYVRVARTNTAASTVANGTAVSVGTPRNFYLDPTKDLFWDVISTGAGTFKWRRVGPIMERARA